MRSRQLHGAIAKTSHPTAKRPQQGLERLERLAEAAAAATHAASPLESKIAIAAEALLRRARPSLRRVDSASPLTERVGDGERFAVWVHSSGGDGGDDGGHGVRTLRLVAHVASERPPAGQAVTTVYLMSKRFRCATPEQEAAVLLAFEPASALGRAVATARSFLEVARAVASHARAALAGVVWLERLAYGTYLNCFNEQRTFQLLTVLESPLAADVAPEAWGMMLFLHCTSSIVLQRGRVDLRTRERVTAKTRGVDVGRLCVTADEATAREGVCPWTSTA